MCVCMLIISWAKLSVFNITIPEKKKLDHITIFYTIEKLVTYRHNKYKKSYVRV